MKEESSTSPLASAPVGIPWHELLSPWPGPTPEDIAHAARGSARQQGYVVATGQQRAGAAPLRTPSDVARPHQATGVSTSAGSRCRCR